MEWESLDDEHDLLLSKMREMKERLNLWNYPLKNFIRNL
jgi:hypothetical protein